MEIRKTLTIAAGLLAGSSAWAGSIDLQFTPVATGLHNPTDIENAGDGSGRIFIAEQTGRIMILQSGEVLPDPFLDIEDEVTAGGERGLVGLAFPPGLGPKDHFYAYYIDNDSNSVLARFQISADPNRADEASEKKILTLDQPFSNHNGGQLVFGPDGYLYLGLGDGGSQGDPGNRAQNLGLLFGKILRLDVEGQNTYTIPADNPFVGNPDAQPEIWAYGLRNPWRYTFDPLTGDLFIADVGQSKWEEIDFQPAGSAGGQNYGWHIMEANHCYQAESCDMDGLVLPVAEYGHTEGACSITGGRVYRASLYPALDGTFVYGDFCSGSIWGLQRDGNAFDVIPLAETGFGISTFGADQAGNLYVADLFSGNVYLISDGPPAAAKPAISQYFSGNWFGGPSRDGEGFLLEVLPGGQLLAYWFTYDEFGNQMWLVALGPILGDQAVLDARVSGLSLIHI